MVFGSVVVLIALMLTVIVFVLVLVSSGVAVNEIVKVQGR